MKGIIKIAGLALFMALIFSCFLQRGVPASDNGKLGIKGNSDVKDSTEYELIVFDVGFDYWLNSHGYSANQYSNEYLQSMNNRYVQEWNRRYIRGDRRMGSNINYDFFTPYNIEFNFKLFMYFKYFEETNRIKLLQ
jgi:hypothetical protein